MLDLKVTIFLLLSITAAYGETGANIQPQTGGHVPTEVMVKNPDQIAANVVNELKEVKDQLKELVSATKEKSFSDEGSKWGTLVTATVAIILSLVSTVYLKRDVNSRIRAWINRRPSDVNIRLNRNPPDETQTLINGTISIQLVNSGILPALKVQIRSYARLETDPAIDLKTLHYDPATNLEFVLGPNEIANSFIGITDAQYNAAIGNAGCRYGILVDYSYGNNKTGYYKLEGRWQDRRERLVSGEMG